MSDVVNTAAVFRRSPGVDHRARQGRSAVVAAPRSIPIERSASRWARPAGGSRTRRTSARGCPDRCEHWTGRGQFTGPHERDARTGSQAQPTATDGHAPEGAFQRRHGLLTGFDLGWYPTLDLERVVQPLGVGPQTAPAARPAIWYAATSNARWTWCECGQIARRWLAPDPVLVDRLVPQGSAPIPLGGNIALFARAPSNR